MTMMMRRKLDTKFGCVDERAALPATDGTDRRACDWHRRPHRVRLVTIFLRLTFLFLCRLCLVSRYVFSMPVICASNAERRLMFSASQSYGSNRAYRHYKFAIRVTNGSMHHQSQERLSSSASRTPGAQSSSLI